MLGLLGLVACTGDITTRWENCGCTGEQVCFDEPDSQVCGDRPAQCEGVTTCGDDACTTALGAECDDENVMVECEERDDQDAVFILTCG